MQRMSVWLAHTNSGTTEALGTIVEPLLVDVMDLVKAHYVSRGKVLPVGLHSLTGTTLGLVT